MTFFRERLRSHPCAIPWKPSTSPPSLTPHTEPSDKRIGHRDGTRWNTRPSTDSREPAILRERRPTRLRGSRHDSISFVSLPVFRSACRGRSLLWKPLGTQFYEGSWDRGMPTACPFGETALRRRAKVLRTLVAIPFGYVCIILALCVKQRADFLKKLENFVNVERTRKTSCPSAERICYETHTCRHLYVRTGKAPR